jgi:inhibitor of KinA sporulation pathway (predicted exonuclease)
MRLIKDWLPHDFIIYDLEYTAWLDSKETSWSRPGEYREIVEIGAAHVVRDGKRLQVIQEYSQLVLPARNPILSDYFTALTGINQADIDSCGLPFPDSWKAFSEFADRADVRLSFGEDDEVLFENLILNGLDYEIEKDSWINYRSRLCQELQLPEHTCSSDLPKTLRIKTDALRLHRAIDDVYSQLAAMRHLLSISD